MGENVYEKLNDVPIFKAGNKMLSSEEPAIIAGILNVTPDSFSDGGRCFELGDAIRHAKAMIADGARIIDIGGESTRPGSEEVSVEEEIRRVIPVIKALRDEGIDVWISVDTWRSTVAYHALEAGADIINDITGLLGDDQMAALIKEKNSSVIAMFNPIIMRPEHEGSRVFRTFGYGNPFSPKEQEEMLTLPIVDAMKAYLNTSLERAFNAGVEKTQIMLDPGIGFGLTMRENLELLHNVQVLTQMGYCSFVGVSRKRFIINMLKNEGFDVELSTTCGLEEADNASAFLTAILASNGVNVLRVHEVLPHYKAAMVGYAIKNASSARDINFLQYQKQN